MFISMINTIASLSNVLALGWLDITEFRIRTIQLKMLTEDNKAFNRLGNIYLKTSLYPDCFTFSFLQ